MGVTDDAAVEQVAKAAAGGGEGGGGALGGVHDVDIDGDEGTDYENRSGVRGQLHENGEPNGFSYSVPGRRFGGLSGYQRSRRNLDTAAWRRSGRTDRLRPLASPSRTRHR